MTRTAVITQSNYLPWRGYFDLIRRADVLVLMDSVQYTRRDWRNRNLIKTSHGPQWLTIPVEVKGRYLQSVDETRVSEKDWAKTHGRALELAYKQSAGFESESGWLFGLLEAVSSEAMISTINWVTLRQICDRLRIDTPFERCVDLLDRHHLAAISPSRRLVELCRAVGADRYLSGPTAKSYLEVDLFEEAGIEVAWMSYEGYPEYPQLWGDFDPRVSIVDLLLNVGWDSPRFLVRQAAETAP